MVRMRRGPEETAVTGSHLCPLLSLLLRLGFFCLWLARWFVLRIRHVFSIRGGGCELHRALRTSPLRKLEHLGSHPPIPEPRCGSQDGPADSLAAGTGSFHLFCGGNRTEIVTRPSGGLGLGVGEREEVVVEGQESGIKAKATDTLLCSSSSVFPLPTRVGAPCVPALAWLRPPWHLLAMNKGGGGGVGVGSRRKILKQNVFAHT